MKKSPKDFWQDNKKELIIGAACIVVGAAGLVIVLKSGKKRYADQFTTYTKEQVIKFLREATNPNGKYAIFKETAEDAFQIVRL